MAYQTGTVVSASDLASTIRSFALANEWSPSGLSEVVYKDGCHVRISSPSESEVMIEGARSGNFATPDLCPRYSRIYNAVWPSAATYHLVAFTSPDTIWCTINFAVTDYMHLGFGALQKYGDWVGGMWFHAQHSQNSTLSASLVDGGATPFQMNSAPNIPNECGLFWNQNDRDYWGDPARANKASMLHCELRGEVWAASIVDRDSLIQRIHCPSILAPAHRCNPNTFNGQTVLTPFQLFLQNTDGHYMPIGHVEHVRFLKLTNYNPGDVIPIGSDRWKVFPWFRKDIANPDGRDQLGGAQSVPSTGVLGVAVRYDGA